MEKEYYVARDSNGDLYMYNQKPSKFETFFDVDGFGEIYDIDNDLFPTVTFDNSPQKIKLELCKHE